MLRKFWWFEVLASLKGLSHGISEGYFVHIAYTATLRKKEAWGGILVILYNE